MLIKSWLLCLVMVLLLGWGEAQAGQLAERIASFPQWQSQPAVSAATGDLAYPDWMAGTWNVTSTLVDLVAPLAPKLVTPGFESNRRYLNLPVKFQVRFVESRLPVTGFKLLPQPLKVQVAVVADRAFNGLNLARAYLGDRTVTTVKVDPESPNRQVTLLTGDRQLISLVTGRATETPAPDRFITTEVFQQVFRSRSQPYFNSVETTNAYQHLAQSQSEVEADQITAVYLSPQDPDYFQAGTQPVALYRYRLEFTN